MSRNEIKVRFTSFADALTFRRVLFDYPDYYPDGLSRWVATARERKRKREKENERRKRKKKDKEKEIKRKRERPHPTRLATVSQCAVFIALVCESVDATKIFSKKP